MKNEKHELDPINEKSSLLDIGALVCQKLSDIGINCFLSGGAVVSIYTHNQYESYDLDFVSFGDRKKIKSVMESLGFKQEQTRHYIHPKSKYFVEFPGTSMVIGDEQIKEFETKSSKGNKLILLTPTDCIKDRLSAFFHWNDLQTLDQAVLVYQEQGANLRKIEEFSKNEGHLVKYKIFLERINQEK